MFNIKKVRFVCAALIIINSFVVRADFSRPKLIRSHDIEATWKIVNIPHGTIVELKDDVTIPPNANYVHLKTGEVDPNPFVGHNYCAIGRQYATWGEPVYRFKKGMKFLVERDAITNTYTHEGTIVSISKIYLKSIVWNGLQELFEIQCAGWPYRANRRIYDWDRISQLMIYANVYIVE